MMKYVYGNVITQEFGNVKFVLEFTDYDIVSIEKMNYSKDVRTLLDLINCKSVNADGISRVVFPTDIAAVIAFGNSIQTTNLEKEILKESNLLDAVKSYRCMKQASLQEAKDEVEKIFRKFGRM